MSGEQYLPKLFLCSDLLQEMAEKVHDTYICPT